jgi:hypothetical protein
MEARDYYHGYGFGAETAKQFRLPGTVDVDSSYPEFIFLDCDRAVFICCRALARPRPSH